MRFESIKEWKRVKMLNKSIDESSIIVKSDENFSIIDSIISQAISENLPKKQTVEYVKAVYTDSSKAPESISVSAVRENLDSIIKKLNKINNWPDEQTFLKLVVENIKNEDDVVFSIKGTIKVYNKSKLYDDVHMSFLKESKALLLYKDVKWIKEILK